MACMFLAFICQAPSLPQIRTYQMPPEKMPLRNGLDEQRRANQCVSSVFTPKNQVALCFIDFGDLPK